MTRQTVISEAMQAIIDRLVSSASVDAPISRVRLRNMPKTQQQAVVVLPNRSLPDPSINATGLCLRTSHIAIECYARDGRQEAPDEAVDQLLLSVHESLMDPEWSWSHKLIEKSIEYEFGMGEEGICCAALVFEIQSTTTNNTLAAD